MSHIKSLIHMNGNPIASIDVETTGDLAGYHEIIQIAVIPLDINFDQAPNVKPFFRNIAPLYPEREDPAATRAHKLDLEKLIAEEETGEVVADYFVEWFSALPLGLNRRLTPLAHNWGFERGFLSHWLGTKLMMSIFTPLFRDTMGMGLFLNDRAAMMGYDLPFKYTNLTAMLQRYGVVNEYPHNAYYDAKACAELYKRMMTSVIK